MSRSETPFKREEPTELAALMAETAEVVVDDAADAERVGCGFRHCEGGYGGGSAART